MPNTKHITVDQTSQIMTSFASKADARFIKQTDQTTYTVTKQATAEEGYSSSYQLFSVVGGVSTAVGDKINIPKDMVVSSGTVETVTTADVPYSGAVPGDKYIDLVIANAASSHIYIPVNDLVDEYTAGNGIDITGRVVSTVVDSSNANGLSVGANGLALAEATTTTAGAMSAADKTKLDGADVTPYTGSGAIDVTSHVISVGAASTSAAGTMSAEDKAKLDNADVTAYTGSGAIDITNHVVSVSAATTTAAGTMSAEDKAKLDGADVTAYTGGNGVNVASHEVSVVVDSTNANGLSVGANGVSLAPASSSTAGAMSAADKAKLDGLDTATAEDIQGIIDAIWPAA